MRIQLRHIALALCALLVPARSSAQLILVEPLSARVTSMGGGGVADNSTPSTIVVNPANVIGISRLYAQGQMETADFADNYWIRRANAGMCWRPGQSGIAVGFDVSFARFNIENLFSSVGLAESHTEDAIGLTAGLGIVSGSNDFVFGAGAKRDKNSDEYETETEEANGMAFDVGAAFHHASSLQGWDVHTGFGGAVVNAGDDIENHPLPRAYNLGTAVQMVSPTVGVMSARVPLIAFTLNLDASKPKENDWKWMVGTELAVAQMFFLRSGLHTYTGDEHPDPALAAWGAGVGIPAGKLRTRLDYGRRAEAFGKFERWELTLEWSL